VNAQYVDYTKADPNIYFTAGQTNCMVNLTFVYEVAFYRNSMGYFTFTRGSKPTSTSGVAFTPVFSETTVDCSRTSSQPLPGTSCLAPGSTISLGPFSSTQGVGFYLKQDSICGGTTTFYSVDALNKVTSRWKPIPAAHGRMIAVLRVRHRTRTHRTRTQLRCLLIAHAHTNRTPTRCVRTWASKTRRTAVTATTTTTSSR
jgi:hypothetical protein